jgi:DNA repair exonuclease SbcCD ATPase subunit
MRLIAIELENFQSHKSREVRFSPGITTIIGATDLGKSAILRAMQWSLMNGISGDEFVRDGAKSTTVKVSVDSNGKHIIIRSRSKGGSTNTYHLDGNEYKAFSTSVPKDIQECLRLDEINFQSQHDAPFWFSISAGEVSRRLNAIIDLSVIDTTMASISSNVRKCSERKELCEERHAALVAVQKTHEDEGWAQNIADFKALKKLKKDADSDAETLDEFEELVTAIRSIRSSTAKEKAKDGEAVLAAFEPHMEIVSRSNDLEELILSLENLSSKSTPPPSFDAVADLFRVLAEDEECLDDLADALHRLEDVNSKSTPPPNFDHIVVLFDTAVDDEDSLSTLTAAGSQASSLQKRCAAAQEALQAAEEEFHKQTKGQMCPLCKNQLA